MSGRLVLMVVSGVLLACSGAPAQTQIPGGSATPAASAAPSTPTVTSVATPNNTPDASATPAPTSQATISYECSYVTMEEIAAITGRTVLKAARSVNSHLCSWILGSKAGQPAGEITYAWLRSWADLEANVAPDDRVLTVELFTGNYRMTPLAEREPGVGEGGYWAPNELDFLYRGQVYITEYEDAALSEAEVRSICVAIAQAAIPRL